MNRKSIAIMIGTCWGALGFKRGINTYDNDNDSVIPHMYTDRIISGLYGTCLYINPITFLFVIQKELYRLEVNIRNIESEKDTIYYKKL